MSAPAQAFEPRQPAGRFCASASSRRHHVGSRTRPVPNWLPTPRAGQQFELFARACIPAADFRMPPVEPQPQP
jgi:hypothetical protein